MKCKEHKLSIKSESDVKCPAVQTLMQIQCTHVV